MARAHQTKRKRAAAAAAAAAMPPRLPSKREKERALTKKQLHQQEKRARGRPKQRGPDGASMFGPLAMANALRNGQSQRFNNKNNNVTVVVDGAPLHANKKPKPKPKKPNNKRPKSVFQLQDIKNPKNCRVPWWTTEDLTNFSAPTNGKRTKKRHYLFGSNPPHDAWWSLLDAELESFSNYVQVADSEMRARNYIVQTLQQIAQSNLDCVPQNKTNDVKVQVFGSYATPSVCAFCSDVDMALHGVVPPEEEKQQAKSNNHIRFNAKPKPPDKVQKWRDLLHVNLEEADDDLLHVNLQEADDDDEEVEIEDDIHEEPDEWKNTLEQLLEGANEGPDVRGRSDSCVSAATKATSATGDDSVVDLTTAKEEEEEEEEDRKPAARKRAPPSAKEQVIDVDQFADADDEDNLQDSKPAAEEPKLEDNFFVVDRVGAEVVDVDLNSDKEDEKKDDKAENIKCYACLGEGCNMLFQTWRPARIHMEACSPSQVDRKARNKCGRSREKGNDLIRLGLVERPAAYETTVASNPRKRSLSADHHSGSDSEEDTADKLASLRTNNKKKKPKPSQFEDPPDDAIHPQFEDAPEQAVISLSSDDDDDEQQYDMHIVNQPPKTASFGPSGAVRVKVVNALGALGNVLRKRRFTNSVQVIRHARVPIVKFETKMGFEADVAMAGHNGTDTSQFAKSKVAQYKSFATVVMALKIMLWQQNLDTPFIGGLGSYKLYVLVAHHLERHLELGGADRPGEVFLCFLYRYGWIRRGIGILDNCDKRSRTFLQASSILECQGGYKADLQACFLLKHCVELFQRCFMKIGQENVYKQAPKKGNSILVDLFHVDKLIEERTESLEKAEVLEQFCKATKRRKREEMKQQQKQQGKGGQNKRRKSK